ncbi:hypothetical protein K466DRAFT_667240 [Polyporus arcularius HHB13444]|uniref:Homeobox domain-containing protein n=1 Tax=Polyporus arcularius HHB13444 TaxID=1314778 RepID=A0A5C3NV93_9APHY|nr:hypothetical protein K466DRAFT_667240 [Polyporus arcularius HHB13444]
MSTPYEHRHDSSSAHNQTSTNSSYPPRNDWADLQPPPHPDSAGARVLTAASSFAPSQVVQSTSNNIRGPHPVINARSPGVQGPTAAVPGGWVSTTGGVHAAFSGVNDFPGGLYGTQMNASDSQARTGTNDFAGSSLQAASKVGMYASTYGPWLQERWQVPFHSAPPIQATSSRAAATESLEEYLKNFYETRSKTPTPKQLFEIRDHTKLFIEVIEAWFADQRSRDERSRDKHHRAKSKRQITPDVRKVFEAYMDTHGPWIPGAAECNRLSQELGIETKNLYNWFAANVAKRRRKDQGLGEFAGTSANSAPGRV